MGLDTNFNQDPYYDDYNEGKGFHKILFKPGVAVQARELTQLQTILQTQIERFGDNILKEGTIVKGCNFNYIKKLPYVKIQDLQTDGQPVVMSNYTGLRAVGLATGVEAYVIDVRAGLESQTPNLNTLYVKYVKSSGANKTFSSTEQIQLRNFKTGAVVTSVTGAGTVTGESATTIGLATALKISDGVIYQKGNFILVDEQITIVEKYGTEPDGVAVGFNTAETIVSSNNDTSLLDNAQGYNNENAPGADRIKLTPTLVVKTVAAANADENFFTLVEYQNGLAVRRNETTQYSVIGEEFARRTAEESGDYVIQNFPLSIKAGSNSSFLEARVGKGLAYVDGKRIETFGSIDIIIDAGTETSSVDAQNVTTNIGHYVIVDEMMGSFPFNKIVNVSLYDTAQNVYAEGGILNGEPTGEAIGTAKIRGIEYLSGTVGTNTCKYKAYIFDIRMTDASYTFAANVKHIWHNDTIDAKADIVLENGKAVIKDVSFKKTFWNVGVNAIKEIQDADFVYSTVSGTLVVAIEGNTSIVLTGTNVWPYGASATLNSTQKNDIVLICTETQAPYTVGKPIDLSGATITTSSDSKTLSFTGMSAPAEPMDVVAYYKVKKNAAAPAEKQTKTVYVKIDNTNTALQTGIYSLGLPDVYSIEAVYKSDNDTYTDGVGAHSLDVTQYFRLYPNQRDAYYDLSYVRKTRALTINAGDALLFKVKVFKESNSGSFGDGYFSVDSYTGIDIQDIPVYTSESGDKYDLRDVVDFRPYCVATAAYAESVGAATVMTAAVGAAVTFADDEQYVVAPNENMEIDYEYYLPRIDRLFVDSGGRFNIIKGVAEDRPTVPAKPARGMSLATIKVPPFPSLTSFAANRAKKPDYTTKLILDNVVNGYTMNEIGQIDRRVKQLEYYTILSALESESKSKAIVDENGLDRFKNGIFSDTFSDLRFAKVDSTEFSAAIDPTYGEITPQIRQFDVDLKVSAVSDVTDFGGTATLTKTDTVLITQPYGTRGRNCVTDFYKFTGTAFIFPQYDSGYDVTRTPDYNLNIDLATPFIEFTEALNKIIPLQQVSSVVASQQVARSRPNRQGTTTTTTTTALETIEALKVSAGSETKEDIGDFVTDIRFNPFMRQQELRVQVHGLRPETEFHFFFDTINVDAHVAPGVLATNAQGQTSLIKRSRAYGTSVSSDSAGKLLAVFRIPAGEFFVGDRKLEIYDVATYNVRDTAVSSATVTYSAFNYSVNKKGVNLSTKKADYSITTSSKVTVATTSTFERTQPVEDFQATGDGNDPIAQTFLIKPEMAKNDNVLYATKMDLYFETKSDTLGFTLYIPEVESGIITSNVVPGSAVHVDASSVNASLTGGSATTVTFPAPIPLLVGREYAFVVKPDGNNPDYRIWVSKTGETDVLTSKKITQDTNEGTLFTSTNARSWTAYQDENIKYTLHRASYTTSTGTIDFTNKDSEYLSIGSVSGTFDNDEYVFVNTAVISAQTVSMTAGSTTITGTDTTFSSYFSVGNHIVVKANTTVFDVLEIASISNNTTMVLTDIPKYTNTASTFFKSVVGTVTLFDSNDPAILYLDNSTAANSTIKFAAGNVLIGENSGAQATITSVDNKNISYMAPNIYRTNTTQTKTLLSGTQLFRNDTNALYAKGNIPFNNFTYLNSVPTVIKSRSNELTDDSGAKSFVLRTTLQNTSGATPRYSSPVVDVDIASVKITEYIVNDSSDEEYTNDGAASSKYITKTITLADGLDAEDLRVYLTAYRPPGTTIEVYAKFLSNEDSDSFDSKPWTKLDSSASNPVSQNNNRFDYKEHEFSMPTAVVNGGAFLNSGAFKYTSGTFVAEDFKYFAIKIVLRSTAHHRVPRVSDIRAIALSA